MFGGKSKKINQIDSLSQKGFAGQGVKKENQDRYFIHYNLNNETSSIFMGVCDGHGIVGHDVSSYLIKHLPANLNTELKKTNKYIKNNVLCIKT